MKPESARFTIRMFVGVRSSRRAIITQHKIAFPVIPNAKLIVRIHRAVMRVAFENGSELWHCIAVVRFISIADLFYFDG